MANCLAVALVIVGFSVVLAISDIEEVTKANNLQFSPSVYEEISKTDDGNFLFSPFSAIVAIAFAEKGCKGETAREILRALHLLPHSKDQIDYAFESLLPKLRGTNDTYTLQITNKMYIKQNFTIKDAFNKTATHIFHSESENIDFTKNVDAANTINEWVEKQTENKIHDLIDPQILDNYTRLVLVNGLYFKGDWAQEFFLASTTKSDFYRSDNDVVKVDMMHLSAEYFSYYESRRLKAKFLKIPFKGEDAYMVFVLPNAREGLADLEKRLHRVVRPHNFTKTRLDIAIPKFKIETEVDFKPILEKLGVHKAFDDKEADLSGISGKPGDLVIDTIKQKTFIDVSEKGVEAAAATFVVITVPRGNWLPRPKAFIADHPFIFFIEVKGVMLFAGRVVSPN